MSSAAVYRVSQKGANRFVVECRPPFWASMFGLFWWNIDPRSHHHRTEEQANRQMAAFMRADGYDDYAISAATGGAL